MNFIRTFCISLCAFAIIAGFSACANPASTNTSPGYSNAGGSITLTFGDNSTKTFSWALNGISATKITSSTSGLSVTSCTLSGYDNQAATGASATVTVSSYVSSGGTPSCSLQVMYMPVATLTNAGTYYTSISPPITLPAAAGDVLAFSYTPTTALPTTVTLGSYDSNITLKSVTVTGAKLN